MRMHSGLVGIVFAAMTGVAACGTTDTSIFGNGAADAGGGANDDSPFGGPGDGGGDTKPLAQLTVDPPTAALALLNAPFPTMQFTATAHYVDGTSAVVTPSWSASNASVGSVGASGLYTPRGSQGGVVTITANAGGKSGNATLTVTLRQVDNSAGVDPGTQAGLLGATAPDPMITWTYPYDATAFPRGLNAPQLMWNGATGGDVYLVHIESPTYELQAFTTAAVAMTLAGTAPAGGRSFAFPAATWASFVDSTPGTATLTVARKTGTSFTRLVRQTWSIASRSMSGSIYYWAINQGAVVRIQPGAMAPDPFLAGATVPPGGSMGTAMYCPSCHTASADGSTLVMGTGDWGGSSTDTWSTIYDLKSSATSFYGYETGNPATDFPLAGVTPDGKILVENWAQVRGSPSGKTDSPVDISAPVLSVRTVPSIAGTNLEALVGAGHHTYFPVFSADNALFAYVDSVSGNLISLSWDATTKKFSNAVELAAAGASLIAYPTISPDHRWVVYQRGPDYGSLDTSFSGDLYAVDTTNPMREIALDGINKTYSLAAGTARDAHRSYEPTFAPVASGGFFWLVFHSRRTYGNELVDVPYINGSEGSGTKQLWVAAINVPAAASTTDPSHAPFWLPGQDPQTRNMRGYWALNPCEKDGATCATGTDCCGGFCDATNDAGLPVCGSMTTTCSRLGDRCNVTADCCNSGSGVTCIGHACSEPTPR